MAAIKFLLFACLAFSAGQAQAASTDTEPKDGFFLYQILEDAIKCVKIVVGAIKDNLPKIDEVVQELIKLLPKDTVENVRKIVDWIKQAVTDEDAQFAHIIELLEKALEDLKAIDSCTAPEEANLKKALDTLVSAINKGVQDAFNNHTEEVDNCIAGLKEDLTKLRALYDTNLPAAVKCLTPGNKDACTCLDNVKNTVVNGTIALGDQFGLHLQEVKDVIFDTVVVEAWTAISPAFTEFSESVEEPNKNICECVSNS